jgi:hypothetical protein
VNTEVTALTTLTTNFTINDGNEDTIYYRQPFQSNETPKDGSITDGDDNNLSSLNEEEGDDLALDNFADSRRSRRDSLTYSLPSRRMSSSYNSQAATSKEMDIPSLNSPNRFIHDKTVLFNRLKSNYPALPRRIHYEEVINNPNFHDVVGETCFDLDSSKSQILQYDKIATKEEKSFEQSRNGELVTDMSYIIVFEL